MKVMRIGLPALLLACSTACSNRSSPPPDEASQVAEQCPRALPAPHLLPGSRPEHRDPGLWISRLDNPDELLLTTEHINALNRQNLRLSPNPSGMGARYSVLTGQVDPSSIMSQMQEGIQRHRAQTGEGHRVTLDGDAPPQSFFDDLEEIQRSFERSDEFRLVTTLTELRCHPTSQGLYEYEGDVDFDLLLCSTLRAGEAVRIISRHPQGWLVVRSPYVAGWVREGDLGPALTGEEVSRYLEADPFVVVVADRTPIWATIERRQQIASVRIGLRLPLLESSRIGLARVLAPSTDGLREGYIDADSVHVGYLPLTWRHVINHSFSQLDDAFGWAGAGGDRDCSRFLMDLFALFGLHLPRNSFYQSRSGSFTIDIGEMSATERSRALDHALERGIPLLFMPGHIMLLLGRDGDDYHAIHQFSGYRAACRPGEDIKMAVDRLAVTTLRLGQGSERRSFMDRITRIAVFTAESD